MSQAVTEIMFDPTKSDNEKGRWLLDSTDFPLPDGFTVAQSAMVGFAPNGWAADHRHGRREALLGLAGELYLVWRETDGERKEARMVGEGALKKLFVIAPNVPHLVENRSGTASAALYEWSDLVDESIPLEGAESLRA